MRPFLILLLLVPRLVLADAEHPEQDDASVLSCSKKGGEVAITFKPDIEVKELITWAMGFTCNKYMYDQRYVQNRHVTVMAPEKMSPHDAYELFLGSLATAGLAVVKKGDAWVIVESQAVKREAVPFVQHPGDGNEVVRFVFRPAYAKPEMLVTAFEAVKSDAGEVKQLGSVVMITDYARNVEQMISLAKQIDVPAGSDGIFMIPVMHADATKLKAKLDDILGTAVAKPDAPQPKILVDERTNTLIVAGPQAVFERVKALVDRLDIALDIEGGASIHVYQLGNAIAEEVAKTLNDAIQRTQGGAQPQTPKTATPADAMTLEGQVHVIADPKTNKLIVTASGRDYLAIQDVIRQLDEPRRQVYIETVVLSVDTSNDLSAGTSSHGAIPTTGGNSIVVGGVETQTVNTLDLKDTVSGFQGLLGGIVGSALTSSQSFLGTSIPSYAVLFSALAVTAHNNTVSTPSIIAVDNETTKFHVGQNVPYQRGVVPVSSVTPGITNTNIDRQDLNFELDIKPHISANDNVMLEITNDAKEYGVDTSLGPTWNTRGFETRVVVHDQQTIVLSGLTQDHESTKSTKVPIVGDIPLLGYLFKYTKRTKTRSNVLILLTPYIIKDQLDLQRILDRKGREHDEFVASFHALDHMPYVPKIDYRKKRGLVEEINRSIQSVEEESEARAQIHETARVVPGPVQ